LVPECVVVKCDCGERPVLLTTSETAWGCRTDHAAFVRKELASRGASDWAPHPWEAVYQEWRKKNEYLVSEDTYWLELSAID
jgi:hypothetical protein